MPAGLPVLALRKSKAAVMGEDVFTIGYPLGRMLGANARMTKGLLSATTGLHDDDREVQVSAEIEPGNSSGPLLDHDSNVIGVIDKTINPAAVVRATGGFALTAYDYDTQEPLFAVGQGRDDMVSNEVVIHDTLAQFRTTVGAR